MPTVTVDVELHAGQDRILREARRFNVASCGRRWGKSVLAEVLMTETAGERGQRVGYFAPTYKLLAETWRDMDADLGPVLVERSLTERRMKTVTDGVVEMWTLEDMDAGRSRRYHRVIIDEAGLVPHLGDTWERAIRPTLADHAGDAWFLGTPKGRNFFWQVFNRGADPCLEDWASWQMPTHSNPWIKPSEIEAMRQSMTDRSFRQEVLAEFLEDGGGVFRFVHESATSEPLLSGVPGHQYAIAADWGRENDATVLACYDVSERRMVALDRMLRTDYALQRTRLHAMAAAFPGATILAEANSMGAPVIEQLQREGLRVIPFTTTNATKAQIVDALALALEQRSVRLLNDPVLIAELEAFESQRLPSGMLRYAAPEGQHDDCVMAACLGWWQVCGGMHGQWSGGAL